ncbi:hypothetical protein MUN78_11930 [Leucobacter allii]|uniref:Uncharacterized protein n=1 Tax=Leucobacter allii TaxID=2932247 RepID=A0ABY4FIP3_9MICO|nr:hypothetical protein [Leucobacter allii]UOQ56383.1 hypothetical protein MUN78_11930 [Leucobacter allii]
MLDMPTADDDDLVQTYRVGVDFSVAAHDMQEARALLERTLEQEDSDGWPFITGDRSPDAAESQVLGVADWQPVPPRPSQAALVQERYPGLVNDVALVEGLIALLRADGREGGGLLPEQTRERIQQTLDAVNPAVMVMDPERQEQLVFEGYAREACEHLAEGVYRGFDPDDREYAVVVAPSEITPFGRMSAAIPADRRDARALDEVSRLLRDHNREQSLTDLVRLISRRVNTTGRDGFPSWVPLEGDPVPAPLPSRAYIGVIVWSDIEGQDPTVIADANATAMTRRLATVLHETLSDRNAFAGATEFLETHRSPDGWKGPEDVVAWLDDLRAATPYPAFWYEQIGIGNAPESAAESREPATARPAAVPEGKLWTYQVPVEFDVSARTLGEARELVDEALVGDALPAAPAMVQQCQRVRADGDVFGVLGWHPPTGSTTARTDAISQVLRQRETDISLADNDRPSHRRGHEWPGPAA